MKIGINGFGRIGRTLTRIIYENKDDIELVIIKDFNNVGYSDKDFSENLAYLLRHDTVYGRFPVDVGFNENKIILDGKSVPIYFGDELDSIDWKDIDVLVDASGSMKTTKIARNLPVKKILITKAQPDSDFTIVMGVNENNYDKTKHHVVSASTCTGNALAPIVKIINDRYKIINGFVTTVHPVLSNEKTLDSNHRIFQLGKSYTGNIKPIPSRVVKSVVEVIPEIKGKLFEESVSYRVPVDVVSVVYAVIEIENNITKTELLNHLEENIDDSVINLSYGFNNNHPYVSSEFIKNKCSGIIDVNWLHVNKNLIRLSIWHDNEYGYCSRLYDILKVML